MVIIMTMQASVAETKEQLSRLIALAEAGEEVVVTCHGVPRVKLVPVSVAKPLVSEVPIDPTLYAGIDMNAPAFDSWDD